MASFKSLLLNVFFFSLVQIRCESHDEKKCEQWDSWSACKNGISTRICLTDESVTDEVTCQVCDVWGDWSACKNGKRHRIVVNCPFIREDQDCDPNKSNEQNTGNNTTIYFNNYDHDHDDDEHDDNFEETLEEESNLPVTGDSSQPSFLQRNSHMEGKQDGMSESFAHIDEADATVQQHNDMLTDTTSSEESPFASDANNEIHENHLNQDAVHEPHNNIDEAQTDETHLSSHNLAHEEADAAPFSMPKRARNFREHKFEDFSSTSGEGQNANNTEGNTNYNSFNEQEQNQYEHSNSEGRQKKHNTGAGNGGAPKFNQTYIASGMGLLFLVTGSAASYALYNGKYQQLNEQAKNENFEVMFNEDMKAKESSKSMYEDEFWALG
ncbi:hypothetical protein AK88_03664 [Plasmodium fragile]|uniref:Merozoite TRAP-like protein n=1 Tax=Plasmodium fragile TaxID=5857 RepID=A0A0D9QIP4_PLAFR|nr:uncharacterized protein AK88_03664 [Plasmodium fragile]KJP86657.1 hypothetical protein AK88_03664 [Plasmodium fragile]